MIDEEFDRMIAENAAKKARGAPKTKNKKRDADCDKNRPNILKRDGTIIGEPFAKKTLGFRIAVVHNDAIHYNVTMFERTAQQSFDKVDELANFKIYVLHEISYQNSLTRTHINSLECIFLHHVPKQH
jgi:hypothetical protein